MSDLTRRQRCGYGHRFGLTRVAVAYYDQPYNEEQFIRAFVCRRHARQAMRLDDARVVWNGGYWPEQSSRTAA